MESEEYATMPVPDDASLPWWRVALMNSVFSLSLPTLVSGLELAKATTGDIFLLALLAAGVILTVIGALTGAIGSITRLSSYMLARIAFGTRGSVLLNLGFAVSLLGWFGVNIDLFAQAMERLLADMIGYSGPGWPIELGAGVLMTATTLVGMRAINWLALIVTPVLGVVSLLMLGKVLGAGSLRILFARGPAEGMSFGDTVSAVVGGVVVGAIIMPDTCRFIRGWKGAVGAAIAAYLVAASIETAIGGFAGLATGQSNMLALMLGLGLGFGAFATVFGGSWTINALNLYSAALSFGAAMPSLRQGLVVLVCGVLGTLAAFANILDHFLTFLIYLAIVFVPVGGIIIVDFFLLRPEAYRGEAQGAERAIRWEPLAAWAAGAAVSILTYSGHLTLTHIAALDAILVAALAHVLLGWRGRIQLRESRT